PSFAARGTAAGSRACTRRRSGGLRRGGAGRGEEELMIMAYVLGRLRRAWAVGVALLLRRLPWLRPIHYVGGSQTLPPPLTAEEEKELLRRLEMGDTSVRSPLIERNLRLVVYIARKFDNTGIPIEDLVSIGTIGLIKAVNTFDPT